MNVVSGLFKGKFNAQVPVSPLDHFISEAKLTKRLQGGPKSAAEVASIVEALKAGRPAAAEVQQARAAGADGREAQQRQGSQVHRLELRVQNLDDAVSQVSSQAAGLAQVVQAFRASSASGGRLEKKHGTGCLPLGLQVAFSRRCRFLLGAGYRGYHRR